MAGDEQAKPWKGDVLTIEELLKLDRNVEGGVTWPLAFPISMMIGEAEEITDTVTVARPKGRHMRQLKMGAGTTAMALTRIEQLTGLTSRQVDELDEFDIMAIGDIMDSFTVPGLATGKTS